MEVRQVRRCRLQGRGGPEDPRQPGNLRRLRGAAEAVRQEPERHHDVGRAGQHPVNLGDEIPKEDVQKMFAEICDPEDEDGLFPYMSFLDRLTGKAYGLLPPSTFIQVTT